MSRCTWLACALFACVSMTHCSPPPARTSRGASGAGETGDEAAHLGGPVTPAECGPEYAACKHAAVRVSHLCYGTNPGPNAERARRVCTCDECLQDGECGGGKRCYLETPTCGAPQRICIEPCKQGVCADGFVCGDGYCAPRPMPEPP